MNHQKVYQNIIEKARLKNRKKLRKNNSEYNYYENHHILPRCLNGGDEKENMQLLTAREHYVCHKLLTYIYPNNRKIALAFFRMTFDKKGKRNISSRDYAYARELLNMIPMSKSTKDKISKKIQGKIRSCEFKEKVSNGMMGINVGKIHSEKSIKNMSDAHIGITLKPFTDEHKENLRKSNTGKKHNMTVEGSKNLSEAAKKRIPWNKGNIKGVKP